MARDKRLKRYLVPFILLVLWAGMYIVGHSPFVSNYLKNRVIEALQDVLDQKVNVENVFINPLPPNIEISGIVIENDEGVRWLNSERLKIYIDLIGLIRKKLSIRRVLLTDAHLLLNRDTVHMLLLLGAQDNKQKEDTVFEIKTFDVRNTTVIYEEKERYIKAEKIRLSTVFKDLAEIRFSIGNVQYSEESLSLSGIAVQARLSVLRDTIKIDSLKLSSDSSAAHLRGTYFYEPQSLKTDIRLALDVAEMSRMLDIGIMEEGRISATGKLSYENEEIFSEVDVSGNFYLESLMSLLAVNEPVRGLTNFNGTMHVRSGVISGSSNAEITNGHLYGLDFDTLTCLVEYTEDKLSFLNGSAILYGGEADAEGYLLLPEVDKYMVDVRADRLDAKNILKLLGVELDVPNGSVTGHFRTEGEHLSPEGWFIANFESEETDFIKRIKMLNGHYETVDSELRLDDVTIKTSVSTLSLDGKIDLESDELSLTGILNTGEFSDIADPYVSGMKGYGFIAFGIQGTVEDPAIDGLVRINSPEYRAYNFDDLKLAFQYKKQELFIKNFLLSSGEEFHRISGSIRFDEPQYIFDFNKPYIDLSVDVKNLRTHDILREFVPEVPFVGLGTGSISVRGYPEDIRSHATVYFSPVSLYGVTLDYIKTEVDFEDNVLTFREISLVQGESVISGALRIGMDGAYEFKTYKVNIDLGKIPLDLNIQKGALQTQFSGKGTLRDPFFAAQVKISDVITEGIPIGDSVFDIILRNKTLSLKGELFNKKSTFKGIIRLKDDFQWELSMKLDKGVYDFIPAYLMQEVPENFSMIMDGELRAWGNKSERNGYLFLNSLHVSVYDYNFSNESPVTISMVRDRINFSQVALRSGNAEISVEGTITLYKNIDVTIYGDSYLMPLKRFFISIDTIKGDGSFVFSVSGDWSEPKINAGISISNTTLGLKKFPYRIIDLETYMYVDDNKVVMHSFKGKVGGGDVSMTGYGYFVGYTVQRFYLDSLLKNVTFRFPSGYLVNFNSNIVLSRDGESMSMVGQLDILEARYTQRIDWKSELLKFRKVEKPEGKLSTFESTELNIKIDARNNIRIYNNVAKTELGADLLLRGTIARPILYGRVETEKGLIYFRNNEFRIIHASADFADPEKFNPFFDITADATIQGYEIRIAIEGHMDQLDMTLVSNPVLDENDILALLAFREFGDESQGIESGIGTAEATGFLTGKYQDVIEERLTMLTGFDRFYVEPYVSKRSGTIAPKVTVSKRLGDKLFLSYSKAGVEFEEDTIKLEYELSKSTSLLAGKDEFGTFKGGIRFRFEFK